MKLRVCVLSYSPEVAIILIRQPRARGSREHALRNTAATPDTTTPGVLLSIPLINFLNVKLGFLW